MDEMIISSKFTTGVISGIVSKIIRKKLGYTADISLNTIKIVITDGKTHIHLDADAALTKDELMRIIKGTDAI